MRVIEMIVSPDGQTSVETKGFTGPACRQASKFVEEALGKREQERMTSEFYQAQSVAQSVRQRN